MSIRLLKWILLGSASALLLLAHSFAAWWQVPPGQPAQTWSKVHYDPKLTDPFFESNKWSYPWWIIKHPDADPKGVEKSNRNLATIKVRGVFKTIVE